MSCPDAIGRLIEKVAKLQNGKEDEVSEELSLPEDNLIPRPTARFDPELSACSDEIFDSLSSAACPECGKPVEHEGGCVVCRHCGYSKCG
jgi:ribonucleoside-diphosphate reductase alpha chain